jgi:flavin-dependent dehydrogenase
LIRCDALIAGGGPAGLAAAIALRQKGLDVLLADALRPPIDKACGEGLMPDAQRDLATLGIRLTPHDGAVFAGITFLAGRTSAEAAFPHGVGIGVRRLRLHALLVERCQELGVRLAWGSRINPMEKQWRLDGEPCSYRYAVGADGQSSRVRQSLGFGEGKILSRRYGARCHYRVRPWSRMVEVHWGDLGQAYITPVGPDEVCVATVARSPEQKIDQVLASLPALRARLAGAHELSRMRGALTTTRKLPRVTLGNVALVGDASGSADAITGEGIALSFRQARLLADAISVDRLDDYEAGHPAILRLPHLMSRVMLSMDRWPGWRSSAMSLLSACPQLFAHLLALHLGERNLLSSKWQVPIRKAV